MFLYAYAVKPLKLNFLYSVYKEVSTECTQLQMLTSVQILPLNITGIKFYFVQLRSLYSLL